MPTSSRSWNHGTMLAWCSISLSSTTSPARSVDAPQDRAMRLNDSVVLRVKTTSGAPPGAPMKPATDSRAPSYSAVASAAVW